MADDRTAVLVELFSSEGCSSCPPADELLASLLHDQPVPGARVVALAEHVDYWDHLGWKDVFALPTFTERQRTFVEKLDPKGGMYTPMMVVDGQAAFVGSNKDAAIAAITAAAKRPHAVMVLTRTQLVIHAVPPGWANRLAVVEVTSPRATAKSEVKAGENAGKTLHHVELAGPFQRMPIDTRHLPITLPLSPSSHRTAVLRTLDGVSVGGTATI